MHTQRQKLNFISWLRTFSVLCILACHLCNEAPYAPISSLGQFFNIGVQLFFILSAFCFGIQGDITECFRWYKKRLKRVFLPYEMFCLGLALLYIVLGIGSQMNWNNWISCVLFCQGANVGVLGADHTWFMTALVLCYLVTPLLSRLWTYTQRHGIWKYVIIIFAVLPVITSYAVPVFVFTIVSQLYFFAIAYFLGRWYSEQCCFDLKKSQVIFLTAIMCLAYAIRLLMRSLADGTKLYEQITVGYTQYIAAFCIFGIFLFVFKQTKPIAAVEYIDKTSFEIYLWHYMFMTGPVSVMKVTGNWIAGSALAVVCSIITASVFYAVKLKLSKRK